MIEIVNKNGNYKYYKIKYTKTKHLNTLNKGVKKTYSIISEYDITTDDVNMYNSRINQLTIDNIVQYTKDKETKLNVIKENFEKKVLTTNDCKYLLKFHTQLYKTSFNDVIDKLYEDTIEKEQVNKLYLEHLKDEFPVQ